MSYPRLYRCAGGTTAFCVFLMMMCVGSGVVWGQSVNDAFDGFMYGYADEFIKSDGLYKNQDEYYQFFSQMIGQMMSEGGNSGRSNNDRVFKRVSEHMQSTGEHPTAEELQNITVEIHVDSFFDQRFALHKALAEKAKELFPDADKMQQRQFQMQESIMSRLESLSNPEDIFATIQMQYPNPFHYSVSADNPLNVYALSDFLELTPEQMDSIKEIQKETLFKITLLRQKIRLEKNDEVNELLQWMSKKMMETKSYEEHKEIMRTVEKREMEMIKGIIPQLKAILIEGRESYMRVLTDAQKAKIKAVMADMPDYMKDLFAAIDQEGGGLSILHNWQPGMGAPNYPNPNREAPRERTNTGGRAFPGN